MAPREEMRIEECPQCRKRWVVGDAALALLGNETVRSVVCAECFERDLRYPKRVRRPRRVV
jgi:hypothetical protein